MRLGSIQEAWGQYALWFGNPSLMPLLPKESVFVFEGDVLLAACCIDPSAGSMVVYPFDYKDVAAGKFMVAVLRGHAKVTGSQVIIQVAADKADELSLDRQTVYMPNPEEETPQARKKETDPGETPHAEPTDQGGTGEDVPSKVAESKPRARRKKAKK